MYTILPATIDAVPWAGVLTEPALIVGVVPSGSLSLARTSTVTAVSSAVEAVSLAAIGARLKVTVVVIEELLSAGVASFSALRIVAAFVNVLPNESPEFTFT